MTVHVGIGNDHNSRPSELRRRSLGTASYTDFLIFARNVQKLNGSVFLNVGTAVMGPEVFLKALSMARNVARQHGESLRDFSTAVFDLVDLPPDWRDGSTQQRASAVLLSSLEKNPSRTVSDGGGRMLISAATTGRQYQRCGTGCDEEFTEDTEKKKNSSHRLNTD